MGRFPVVLTAEDSVQSTDAVASDQEVQSIAQRFQSAGVNVVVGVGGSGSTTWPACVKLWEVIPAGPTPATRCLTSAGAPGWSRALGMGLG